MKSQNSGNPQASAGADVAAAAIAVADQVPATTRARLFGFLGVLLSAVVVIGAASAYRDLRFDTVAALVPTSITFWVLYVIFYLQGPLLDWVIFRRLWNIPLVTGMMALLRKLVSNELVLGYLGEAQFYAWARARANLSAAPFGAIKDVAILSALIGNAVTVVMLVLAWPLVSSGSLGVPTQSIFVSLGVVLLISCAILVLRKKLFSLERRELWFISAIHLFRIIAFIAFSAFLWHLVLPDVSVGLWMVLATLRMLVSRLPLLPNKDIVFTGIAVFVLGHDIEVAALMTMMAAVALASHIFVGVVSGIAGLVESRRSA